MNSTSMNILINLVAIILSGLISFLIGWYWCKKSVSIKFIVVSREIAEIKNNQYSLCIEIQNIGNGLAYSPTLFVGNKENIKMKQLQCNIPAEVFIKDISPIPARGKKRFCTIIDANEVYLKDSGIISEDNGNIIC